MADKERLDVLMVNKGLAASRELAKAYIMAGNVYVDGNKEDKAGTITYTYEGTVLGSVPVYFLQDISFDLGLFFQMNWYWFVLVFLLFLFVIKIVKYG